MLFHSFVEQPPAQSTRSTRPASGSTPTESVPRPGPTLPRVEIIFLELAGGDLWQVWTQKDLPGIQGYVMAYPSVKKALEQALDPAEPLEVLVLDALKASPADIYERVLKDMGVEESFLETSVAILTPEQIYDLRCPEDMALCLCLASARSELYGQYTKPDGEGPEPAPEGGEP